jgi:hypothetical protein
MVFPFPSHAAELEMEGFSSEWWAEVFPFVAFQQLEALHWSPTLLALLN